MDLTERERAQLIKTGHDFEAITPHPDGQPWDKCCKGQADASGSRCQCFTRRPRGGKSRLDEFLSDEFAFYDGPELETLLEAGERFFCIHRTTEDGYYRECAGWYAKFGRKRHEKA